MSKKRTIIQTMITLLVAGATLVGSAIVIGDNGKFIDWNKLKINNDVKTEGTTPSIPEDTTNNEYEETTGNDYNYGFDLPQPDSADDDEKYLDSDNFGDVEIEDNVGAGKEEVTLKPETTTPAETKPQTPETTAPAETTTSTGSLVDYADMISSIQKALNDKYKAESIDDNYKAQVYDIFAVTVNGNNIKTYALAKLPATNSNVLIEINHNHANANLLKETKIDIFKTCDPEKWQNDGYRVYKDTIKDNKISDYTISYIAIENGNEIVAYETLKPKSSGKDYMYSYQTVTRNGVNVSEKQETLTVGRKLNHAKMVEEIKANQTSNENGLTQ